MTTPAETHPVHIGWRSRLAHPPTLAICGVALVVLALIVWNSFAARQRVRIPLTDDLARQPAHEVAATFKALGIDSVTVNDGFLVVAANDEARCRQFLQESTADHATWADEWQRANEQLNPFSSASERSAAREIARARRISQMLSGMPGVQHADVVWDEQTGRGFRHESTVRATVYIRPTSDGHLTPQIVESIREAVAGSKANLAVDDVIVMDLSTGMTHRVQAAMMEESTLEVADITTTAAVEPSSTVSRSIQGPSLTRLESEARYGQPPYTWNRDSFGSSTYLDAPTSSMYLLDQAPAEKLASGDDRDGNSADRWSYVWFGSSLVSSADIDPTGTRFNPHTRIDIDDGEYASSYEPGIPISALATQAPIVATDDSDRESVTEPSPSTDVPAWATVVAEPTRDRTSSTVAPVLRDAGSNGLASRNDFRFFVWVFVGVIVLVAVMRGLRSSSGGVMPPELTITSRPTRSDPAGDSGMRKSQSEHDDANSNSSREAFPASEGSTLSDSETTSAQDADPLAAFDHLGWLDGESIQKLYRCLPDEPWALALSGASTQIQEHVLKSLSRSTSMMLQKRMDSLPAIRLRDVEDAQRRLAEWVRKLDETVDAG